MSAQVEIFGIRHHGPGSARCLEAALESLRPAKILVEGPVDAEDLLPLLVEADMVPPVALLAYDPGETGNAIFWPFAEYSPEYRAILWAHRHGAEVRFIDLPASAKLAFRASEREKDSVSPAPGDESASEGEDDASAPAAEIGVEGESAGDADDRAEALRRDPLGKLAEAAGYEDGESWWSDLVEENPHVDAVFPAIADAMAALREAAPPPEEDEARREAHMRLCIHEAARECEGPIAVVCGAWHVPALLAKHALKDDRALLKGLPRKAAALTWAPWTEPRLAYASGYGAGVRAPGWYAHLWQYRQEEGRPATRWLLRAAQAMREAGHAASTASVIESERLAGCLAGLRGRPAAGFEELREAAVSCLCHGERIVWDHVTRELLSGTRVGEISARTPLSPLMEDLKLQQKKTRLKPEALDRELALDLRSENGLARSTLLHRLSLLGVSWGRLDDPGRSRGTFRERWMLRWEPELAVALVENLVLGPTIEQAAANRLLSRMTGETSLSGLAGLVQVAMTAQLDTAIVRGIGLLETRAAHTSDCRELLITLEPMADVLRYGQARKANRDHLDGLMRRVALEAVVALPHAVRGLDSQSAADMAAALSGADRAIRLAEFAGEDLERWHEGLHVVADSHASTPRLAGAAARLLADAGEMAGAAAAALLGRRLSPGTPVADAADFFEGFFEGAANRLLYEEELRTAVDGWFLELDEEDLVAYLPLFRRVFSALGPIERKRLLEAFLNRGARRGGPAYQPAPDPARWEAHFDRVDDLLRRGAPKPP